MFGLLSVGVQLMYMKGRKHYNIELKIYTVIVLLKL
jgi:hypothetical protein